MALLFQYLPVEKRYQNKRGCSEQAVRTLKILRFLDFTVSVRNLASGCQFTYRYFYGIYFRRFF